MKKIVFLTGTRADYGKLKSLMKIIDNDKNFQAHIFVTGMHMLHKYGTTCNEIVKDGFKNIYKYINQKDISYMDITLSNTILGFSNYISEICPDAIVVHGDRLEALAGAIVGAFNNIRVIHIEGGEVSGTIDESIRHAITKFSHFHFVANEEAEKRILQLGERKEGIFIFGSPDIDIMYSKSLPSIETVKKYYEIAFDKYNILMYHPVTTEIGQLRNNVKNVVDAVLESGENYVVIYPNNDLGSNLILEEYERLKNNTRFRIFPSMKFEYFLTLLRECQLILGNSSSGIREAGVYGKASIDIGNRQKGRYTHESSPFIFHASDNEQEILYMMKQAHQYQGIKISYFGEGKSDKIFHEILSNEEFWSYNIQKQFVDINAW